MNRTIYILLLALSFSACNTNNKQKELFNAKQLRDSFITKDEAQFLNQFPKNFEQFHNYFGWNHSNNTPNILFYGANKYIDYLFELLRLDEYPNYETQIINICKQAEWDTDSVSYFQHKSFEYIKEKKRYHLINELTDNEARPVLIFLFETPHPEFDEEFNTHLSSSKQQILSELFESVFNYEKQNEHHSVTYSLSDYVDLEHYFIKNIDINKDGIPDKIVSADPYQGDEMLLFIHHNGNYKFALKTVNFSEDGGNIIFDIVENETGFIINTAFPDGGFFEAYHHITFHNDKWILTNTIYKTRTSNQEDASMYVCDVKQGIDLSNPNILEQIKQIPDEKDRDKNCTVQKMM